MGGKDKGLIKIHNKALIEYVIEGLTAQVHSLIINANRNLESYSRYDLPVISDTFSGYEGPLAGMASCMQVIETELMLSVPCDSPFVPDVLTNRLYEQLMTKKTDISVAHNGERMQPVFCLLKVSLLNSLLDYLNRGERKIDRWFTEHKTAITDFSDLPDTFFNINTPDDVIHVETQLARV